MDPLSLCRFQTGHIIPSYFHLIRFSITAGIDNIGHWRAHLAERFLPSPLTVLKTDEAQIWTAIFKIARAIKAKCHQNCANKSMHFLLWGGMKYLNALFISLYSFELIAKGTRFINLCVCLPWKQHFLGMHHSYTASQEGINQTVTYAHTGVLTHHVYYFLSNRKLDRCNLFIFVYEDCDYTLPTAPV